MTSVLLPAAEAENASALPFADFWFGVIALVIFLLLFALTWSFRNTAAKVGQGHRTGPADPEATAAHEPGRVL